MQALDHQIVHFLACLCHGPGFVFCIFIVLCLYLSYCTIFWCASAQLVLLRGPAFWRAVGVDFELYLFRWLAWCRFGSLKWLESAAIDAVSLIVLQVDFVSVKTIKRVGAVGTQTTCLRFSPLPLRARPRHLHNHSSPLWLVLRNFTIDV